MQKAPKPAADLVSERANGGTTMRKMTLKTAALASLSAILLSSAAYAEQPKPKKEKVDSYGYEFKDDALLGAGLGPHGDMYKGRPMSLRDRLIRPRTEFVSEMLKSVEAL
jgi:hypothetical protein